MIDGDGGRVCFHFIVLRRRRRPLQFQRAMPGRRRRRAMAATYFSPTMKNPSHTSESFLTRRISLVFFDHPAQKDAEVGDDTTSVVLLAVEILKQMKPFVEEGVHPQIIMRNIRLAAGIAVKKVRDLAVTFDRRERAQHPRRHDGRETFTHVAERCRRRRRRGARGRPTPPTARPRH